MPPHSYLAVFVLAACLATAAAPQNPETGKVEVQLAVEHVPEGLKAGSRVNLLYVTSVNKRKGAKAPYTTRPIAEGLKVVGVRRQEKPADPAKAVSVELQGTQEQAARIETTKTRVVDWAERGPDGKYAITRRPLILRLESATPQKK